MILIFVSKFKVLEEEAAVAEEALEQLLPVAVVATVKGTPSRRTVEKDKTKMGRYESKVNLFKWLFELLLKKDDVFVLVSLQVFKFTNT